MPESVWGMRMCRNADDDGSVTPHPPTQATHRISNPRGDGWDIIILLTPTLSCNQGSVTTVIQASMYKIFENKNIMYFNKEHLFRTDTSIYTDHTRNNYCYFQKEIT